MLPILSLVHSDKKLPNAELENSLVIKTKGKYTYVVLRMRIQTAKLASKYGSVIALAYYLLQVF